MSALPYPMPAFLLTAKGAYREGAEADVASVGAEHRTLAADALAMTLLTLGNTSDTSHGDKMQRAEQARGFLAEAVTALSRARLYDPRIRTLALPVLMDNTAAPGAELSRLHQIATRLLWSNHAYLPARHQATPLDDDSEAQLAVVMQGLARHNRIGRVLRRRWALLALTAAVCGPLLGAPVLGAAIACVAITLGVFRK